MGCTSAELRHAKLCRWSSFQFIALRLQAEWADADGACAGISSIEGRAAQTTNIVLGGDTSLQTWRELDEKVKAPSVRANFVQTFQRHVMCRLCCIT